MVDREGDPPLLQMQSAIWSRRRSYGGNVEEAEGRSTRESGKKSLNFHVVVKRNMEGLTNGQSFHVSFDKNMKILRIVHITRKLLSTVVYYVE